MVLADARGILASPKALRRQSLLTAENVLAPLPHTPFFTHSAIWHKLANAYRSLKYRMALEDPTKNSSRLKLVILGSGFATLTMLESLNTSYYDIVVVSPTNHFAFTPMMPKGCTGALSMNSIVTPLRPFMMRGGKRLMTFYEGTAEDIDLIRHAVIVRSSTGDKLFEVPYDLLVLGVGAKQATQNVPGVLEYAYSLRSPDDMESIRNQIMTNFERACLPNTSDAVRRQLLHFVIIGGGPTGVETAGELSDLILEDFTEANAALAKIACVTIVQRGDKLLPSYGDEAADYATKSFAKRSSTINLRLNCSVTEVHANGVKVKDLKTGEVVNLDSNFVLWASGNDQQPIIRLLTSKLPQQKLDNFLTVDERFRVKGVPSANIFALGDCACIVPKRLADYTPELFFDAMHRRSGAGVKYLRRQQRLISRFPQLHSAEFHSRIAYSNRNNLTEDEFSALLKELDATYQPPPTTASLAVLSGSHLALSLNNKIASLDTAPIFTHRGYGQVAYIGGGDTVVALKFLKLFGGWTASFVWQMIYTSIHFSSKILRFEWNIFAKRGRNISRFRTSAPSVSPTMAMSKSMTMASIPRSITKELSSVRQSSHISDITSNINGAPEVATLKHKGLSSEQTKDMAEAVVAG